VKLCRCLHNACRQTVKAPDESILKGRLEFNTRHKLVVAHLTEPFTTAPRLTAGNLTAGNLTAGNLVPRKEPRHIEVLFP
jgi:hypothetical protein